MLLVAALALAAFLARSAHVAWTVSSLAAEDGQAGPWLDIDWDALEQRNPDVVCWVFVPGTKVSYPLVQASPDDPERWLHRDIDGGWSSHGQPYIDASCDGISGPVCLAFGHHMHDGTMFSDLARMTDASFREEHPHVYVQTRDHGYVLDVDAARVVSGSDSVATSFPDAAAESSWLVSQGCPGEVPECEYVLCTCSYTGVFPGNERTLVFCRPSRVDTLSGTRVVASRPALTASAATSGSR